MKPTETRATFTIDKQLWNDTQKLLDKLGYPSGAMSTYLSSKVENLNIVLSHTDRKYLDELLNP